MFFKTKRKSIFIVIAILVLSFPALVLLAKIMDSLRHLELKSIDLRFQLRGQIPATQNIIIIEIDTSSIDKLQAWPWPRSYHAQLVDTLAKYGAKVVAFDLMFDSDSALGSQEDDAFVAALSRYPNVVLASKYYAEKREKFNLFTWSIPLKKLRQNSVYGFANPAVDIDNTVRFAQLYILEKNKTNLSFDLQTLSQYSGSEYPLQISPRQKQIKFGKKIIPLAFSNGIFTINYVGKDQSFKHIPYYQVLEKRYPNMSIFKDKIVLIGATDPILHDFFYTPFGQMYGVEIHANILQSILENRYLKNVSPYLNLLLTIIVAGIIFAVTMKIKPLKGLAFTFILLSVYSMAVVSAFIYTGIIINWMYPLTLGIVIYFIILLIRFMREEKAKRLIKGMFAQYVAPSVVEELIKNPSLLKLGGDKRELTVFFSDIRAFTTYSENHTPEQVVEILNEYLDAMTQVIFKWHGTLDKYVGDEIMAVWGAPLTQPDHAKLAVRCCWEQLRVLKELQAKWRAEGRDIVDMGMGVNTGEMITGNIGSTMHKDYTVIGDAVNLGARLEAETRHYGTPEEPCYLIISEFTYAHVKDIVKVIPLGGVKVKGKNKPVDIYQVTEVQF